MGQVVDIQTLFRRLLAHRKEARRAAEAGTKAMADGNRRAAKAELLKAERASAEAAKIERAMNPRGVYDSERPSPRKHK